MEAMKTLTIGNKTYEVVDETARNHTHEAATTSTDGFMSASDKTKLDGIAAGATKITVDSALSSTSTNPVQNKVVNAALGNKANIASPTFTGTPKAPTPAFNTNTTQIATTAFVKAAVSMLEGTIESYDYATNTALNAKQDKLTAGDNITIEGGVISATGGASAPHVVAFKKSTNGAWYARKWSNGMLEIWSRNDAISGPSSWASFGSGLYMGERVFNFDFATFTALYSHNVTAAGSGGAGYTGILNAVPTSTSLKVRLLRNSNATESYTISLRIYLIGIGEITDSYGWEDI